MLKTVSLETAKKLKEVGFPQETFLVWQRQYLSRPVYTLELRSKMEESDKKFNTSGLREAAPIAEEILERLPREIGSNSLVINRMDDWEIGYDDRDSALVYEYGKTLVEAAAKMYLWLAENQLLKGEDK